MPLVNSRTPDAIPDEQHQGTYVLKPVSVFMYEEGVPVDSLTAAEVGEVLRYYGVDSVAGLPPVAPKEPALADAPTHGFGETHRFASGAPGLQNLPKDGARRMSAPEAFAAPYGLPPGDYVVKPRKVVKKRDAAQTGTVVFDATLLLLKDLSTEQADYVFQLLAEQLGYDIQ